MAKQLLTTWSGSLHLTYRLMPAASRHLQAFLSVDDGALWNDVYDRLPYDRARGSTGAQGPDLKRYRDPKQVYETAGFLYEDDDRRIRFTRLGATLKRFLPLLHSGKNYVIMARYAAFALAVCQLRNPTGAGQAYDPSVVVFPYRFIWEAMLQLDGYISSDELNRQIFQVKSESELAVAIATIKDFRKTKDMNVLGAETVVGDKKNDRIIPIITVAGFGWTLIQDKGESPIPGHYHLRPECRRIVEAAVSTRIPHKEFATVQAYLEHVSRTACIPDDLR